MAISINSSSSGFRKWSEAQEPRRNAESRPKAAEDEVIAAPDLDARTPPRGVTRWLALRRATGSSALFSRR